jgi:hypothetical protein
MNKIIHDDRTTLNTERFELASDKGFQKTVLFFSILIPNYVLNPSSAEDRQIDNNRKQFFSTLILFLAITSTTHGFPEKEIDRSSNKGKLFKREGNLQQDREWQR